MPFVIEEMNLPRNRKRITLLQKTLMVQFMEANPSLASGRYSATFTPRDSDQLWEELTSSLNNTREASAGKSMDHWKKSWSDLKRNVKEKAENLNKKIGDGSDVRESLSHLEERIASLSGEVAALEQGIEEFGPSMSYDPLTLEENYEPLLDVLANEIKVEPNEFTGQSINTLPNGPSRQPTIGRLTNYEAKKIPSKDKKKLQPVNSLDEIAKSYLENAIELQAMKTRGIEKREQREEARNSNFLQLLQNVANLIEKANQQFDE